MMMMMMNASTTIYNTRLIFYQLRKKLTSHSTKLVIILVVITIYAILNEKYAYKLIFEQECFPPSIVARTAKRTGTNDRHCFYRTWERYTHTLSEKSAKLLFMDINTSCHKIKRIGHWIQDGGWNICLDDFPPPPPPPERTTTTIATQNNLDPRVVAQPCIVYSFGINDDPSFDQDLTHRWPDCTIYAFDPSIGRQSGDPFLGSHIQFYSIGLGPENLSPEEHTKGWHIMTLSSIMKMLHHDHISLVKIDIEGDEWDTFYSWKIDEGEVYKKIGQLVGEVHFYQNTEIDTTHGQQRQQQQQRRRNKQQVEILQLIRDEFGFDIFHRDDNFRWSRLMNVHYDDTKSTINRKRISKNIGKDVGYIRSYRCIELGWKRSQ